MDKNLDVGFKIEVGHVYENLQWVGAENFLTITEIVEELFDSIKFKFDERLKQDGRNILYKGIGILDTTTNEITLHSQHNLKKISILMTCYVQDSETFKGKKIIHATEGYDAGTYINYWKRVNS